MNCFRRVEVYSLESHKVCESGKSKMLVPYKPLPNLLKIVKVFNISEAAL